MGTLLTRQPRRRAKAGGSKHHISLAAGTIIVRAEGNTRFSMWTMMTAFILKVVLDPVFIFLLDLVCEAQPSQRWHLRSQP